MRIGDMAPRDEIDLDRPADHVPIVTWRRWRQDTEHLWATTHPRAVGQEIDLRCRDVLCGVPGHIQRLVVQRNWTNADK
eukprot:12556960-Alexandrium_andersonii.AAC.1